jgi:hypothetical protein
MGVFEMLRSGVYWLEFADTYCEIGRGMLCSMLS